MMDNNDVRGRAIMLLRDLEEAGFKGHSALADLLRDHARLQEDFRKTEDRLREMHGRSLPLSFRDQTVLALVQAPYVWDKGGVPVSTAAQFFDLADDFEAERRKRGGT